jgi:hypothetical protein
MGLDMYLYKNGKEIGYWRKVYTIHNWFLQNVIKGPHYDDYYSVTREQLMELHGICQEVLQDNRSDKLRLGDLSYEEKDLNDFRNTIKILERVLLSEGEGFEYYTS